MTQTTLSLDDTRDVIAALRRRFPEITGPGLDDICYATQNRQNAVRALAADAEVLLVVGAQNSSNSNRLREVGAQMGIPSYLIEDADDIDPGMAPAGRAGWPSPPGPRPRRCWLTSPLSGCVLWG